ncbi:ATPase inhibitor mai-2, mitochondrial-like isoform X1 [Saccostrea echinata]|uniref:ATPase inhibitor mai-2, mitochondrial-like isoform X1 n=1 Tax=Saccostrea echinata TaxID=191078 RepID=UPI002A8004E9|nr:ATPase inhibitor mai-2, mitochondrial-like isoform X1 [Saccostrea echinata]XP_061179271.1 ATPase inhibitor mai-2, mitochondrial-like isoform X1 [Saccostrea echinata]XP_061179278.1 ATPase inhibitor mai-2, mitochondrial-like isoform X1 [Saccostrea echinata]
MALRLYGLQSLSRNFCLIGCRMMGNDLGGGAGKGGGTGGTIREAGGTFGKIEAAREEEYIRRLNAQQLKALKEHLDEEVHHHERIIKEHQEAIKRHKQKISELAGKSDTD